MNSNKISFFSLLLFAWPLASFSAVPAPPYYFSADMRLYPSAISGTLLKEYLLYDDISSDVAFIENRPLSRKVYAAIKRNRNLLNIPVVVPVKFGYTLKSVNMKLFPTESCLHKGDPRFDYNQYTRVPPSSPLAVLWRSRNNDFLFVQTEFMRGWVPAEEVVLYNPDMFRFTLFLPHIMILKDETYIAGRPYDMGDKIPRLASFGKGFLLLSSEGRAVYVSKNPDFIPGDAAYSPKTMKFLIENLLGAAYDWGGKEGRRDCSSFVRDLWRVFGANLPRNTSLQAQVGEEILGKPRSAEEFYGSLISSEPFKTLVFFKGHVMIYGGMEKGDYILYHAVNRLTGDDGKIRKIGAVTKTAVFKEGFSSIWKRVTKVVRISDKININNPGGY